MLTAGRGVWSRWLCQNSAGPNVSTDMRPQLTLIVLAVALIFGVAQANAQIPPGNSGADQYTEGTPGAGGNTPSGGGGKDNKGGSGGSGSGNESGSGDGQSLPSDTVAALESQGDEGAQAAAVLQASAPGGERLRDAIEKKRSGEGGAASSGNGGSGPGEESAAGAKSEQGLSDAVTTAFGGSENGMGSLFPILLGLVLVGAIALAVARNRSGSGGSPA